MVVGVEVGDADLFEAGDEFADAAVVFDPGSVLLGLLFVEPAADGFVFDFPGPVPVGAVEAWGVGVAAAAGSSAAHVALLD